MSFLKYKEITFTKIARFEGHNAKVFKSLS